MRREAEAAAQMAAAAAAAAKVEVRAFERRKPARRPLPEHLPRERIVYPAPSACPCCGGVLHKLGEDVTETLELVPRRWKIIQHVREKFSCRSREHHSAAGALASDRARARRAGTARPYPVLQIWPASATQSPERGLCARRHRARRLHPGRLGGRRGGNTEAAR